jgi:dGTPase
MLTPKMLGGIMLWETLAESVQWQGPELDEMSRHRIIRRLIGKEVTDVVTATDERIKDSGAKSALELQKLKHNVIGFSEDMRRRNRELKDFLYAHMYRHHRVVRMQVKAERILTDLFNAYRAEPAILPEHVQALVSSRGLERTLCDYIAGMTDRYATEEHQKLFTPLEKP